MFEGWAGWKGVEGRWVVMEELRVDMYSRITPSFCVCIISSVTVDSLRAITTTS